MLLCAAQGSGAQCERTLTELLVLSASYSNDATIPNGITGLRRCWCPCASGWSPSGWKAEKWAPAWAETAPTEFAEQSPFFCPSDVPGVNKRNKLGHLDASKIKALNANKQRMQFCFITVFLFNTVANDRAERDLMTCLSDSHWLQSLIRMGWKLLCMILKSGDRQTHTRTHRWCSCLHASAL